MLAICRSELCSRFSLIVKSENIFTSASENMLAVPPTAAGEVLTSPLGTPTAAGEVCNLAITLVYQ